MKYEAFMIDTKFTRYLEVLVFFCIRYYILTDSIPIGLKINVPFNKYIIII